MLLGIAVGMRSNLKAKFFLFEGATLCSLKSGLLTAFSHLARFRPLVFGTSLQANARANSEDTIM